MEKNEAPAPAVSLTKTPLFSCDGCEAIGPHKATDDGRAIMCDECRNEYNRSMNDE